MHKSPTQFGYSLGSGRYSWGEVSDLTFPWFFRGEIICLRLFIPIQKINKTLNFEVVKVRGRE